MSIESHQLDPPPEVSTDPKSFEILRLWAAHGQQHVTILSGLNGEPEEFGMMLAQLGQHGAILFQQRFEMTTKEALKRIHEGFIEEWNRRNSGVTGGIPK